MIRLLAIIGFLAVFQFAAAAEPCPGNPFALGTERVMTVDARTTPRVGRKHFPATLPLNRKELVLTFDDGPVPETTPKVLEALARECVRATFFLLGKNAEANPTLTRRILAEGHSIGSHTYQHPILTMVSPDRAEAEINHGIEEIEYVLYGQRRTAPLTPFFRFPGFASTPELLDRMAKRNIVVFGADVWASDWNLMSPEQQLALIVARIEHVGRGIVLFHDTRAQTAAMLPRFLQEMKRRGYRIVHVEPAGGRGILN